jgi:hypothetical protein
VLVAVLLMASMLSMPPAPLQQPPRATEYQVKAAYLFNFGKFVVWPPGSTAAQGDAFPICVIGQDPFGQILDMTLSGEAIGGRSVVARRISRVQDVTSCRILFISSSEEGRLREILGAVDRAGVLTVSDMSGFSQRGGMIQFVIQANKVRFEVDLRPAEEAGLTLSSELLRVAASVRRNPQPGD